jgi:hypothetical protein
VEKIDLLGILDPTIAAPRARIDYAPRPSNFQDLRIGLVENTKKSSEAVLRKIADSAARDYGMSMEVLVHKSQRAPLTGTQIAELKDRTSGAPRGNTGAGGREDHPSRAARPGGADGALRREPDRALVDGDPGFRRIARGRAKPADTG